MDSNKLSKNLRLFFLFLVLAFITYEAYMHQVLGGEKAASVHALCPYGALESLYSLIFAGTFIKKIYLGTFILLGITVILALLFRRSFCGMICPFGALQEFFSMIGQKVFKKRFEINSIVDKPLRYLKYVILVLTVFAAWYFATLWMSPFDPYSAYAHITNIGGTLAEEPLAIIGFILLAITLIGSFLYDRFFCKYLCPAGAFYALIGKFSPTYVERNKKACIQCKSCTKRCPVNIDVAKSDKVNTMECINCNECVNVCPKKGALEIKTLDKKMSTLTMLLLVLGLFFGTIVIAQLTGNLQVKPLELEEGETISLSEIRGSMTIEDAAEYTGLSIEEIYLQLDIPLDVPKGTMLKEIYLIAPGYDFHAAKESITE